MEYELLENITPINVTISKNHFSKHQLIYASQLYGTFFAVSGQFTVEDEKLISIQLTLINYKGLYNLGIVEDKTKKFTFDDEGKLELILHLSAFDGVHGNMNTVTVTCDKIVPVNNLTDLVVSRKLYSFVDLQNGKITEHLGHKKFDSEFYERDGAAIFKKVRMAERTLKAKQDANAPIEVTAAKTGVCETTNCLFVD